MNRGRWPGESGMALLLVLAVIAVLSVVVIGFNDRTQSAMERAFYVQDKVQMQAIAESGVDIGLAVLYHDRIESDHDTLVEDWAKLDSQEWGELFGDGGLRVGIADLSGRFPINRLVALAEVAAGNDSEAYREMLVRLLTNGQFAIQDEIEARIIVDSLTDWLDGDDDPLPYGAENAYYLSLTEPRPARNGPVEVVDELLQVRGMTMEILHGSGEKKGLAEYISIYGNDRININTAPALVLQALAPDISEEDVSIIDDFRRNDDSALLLAKPNWYLSVLGWPQDIVIEPSLITTNSSFFRVAAAARHRTHTLRMTADVARESREMSIYYRSMD